MIIVFLIWLFLILWTTYTVTGEKTNTTKLRTPLIIISTILQVLIISLDTLLDPLREKLGNGGMIAYTLNVMIAFLSPIIITIVVFVVLKRIYK